MENMNLFELATRSKFRYAYKGTISVEDLWDLSAEALDVIYRQLNAEAKTRSEESLLNTKSKADNLLEAKIEIVKYIFMVKVAESAKAAEAKKKREEKARLLNLLAEKQDEALAAKSADEIRKMIEDLDKDE